MHNSSEFLGQRFCVHKHRDKQADVSGGEAAIDGGGSPDSHRIATVASCAARWVDIGQHKQWERGGTQLEGQGGL
jgi:hypothetical protein